MVGAEWRSDPLRAQRTQVLNQLLVTPAARVKSEIHLHIRKTLQLDLARNLQLK